MRPLVAAKSPIWSLCTVRTCTGLCGSGQPDRCRPLQSPRCTATANGNTTGLSPIGGCKPCHVLQLDRYCRQPSDPLQLSARRERSLVFVPLRQQTPWKPVRDLPTISQRASTFLDRICYAYQYLNGKTETDPPESRYARARRGFTNPLLTSQPSRREASTRIRSPVFVEAFPLQHLLRQGHHGLPP